MCWLTITDTVINNGGLLVMFGGHQKLHMDFQPHGVVGAPDSHVAQGPAIWYSKDMVHNS